MEGHVTSRLCIRAVDLLWIASMCSIYLGTTGCWTYIYYSRVLEDFSPLILYIRISFDVCIIIWMESTRYPWTLQSANVRVCLCQ